MNTIIISGAGSGIGLAIAKKMSIEGNSLILLGRNKEKLEKTRNELNNPSVHHILSADIRDPKAINEGFKRLELSQKNITGVVANSGVGGENSYGPNDRWREVIDTNLYGAYVLVQEALPFLRKSAGFKHVVMISSILARLGIPGYTAYCASKAGLLGLMRSMAAEYAPEKILVNAICPGWVDTDMAHQGMASLAKKLNMPVDLVMKEQMGHVPLNKMSQPNEVADLVAYLMNPNQKSVTGQSYDINGGALMP